MKRTSMLAHSQNMAEHELMPIGPAPANKQAGDDEARARLAERSVAGALLRDNSLYDSLLEIISVSDVLDGLARDVFCAVGAIVEGQTEGVTVADALTVSTSVHLSRSISVAELEALSASVDVDPEVVRSHASVAAGEAKKRKLRLAVSSAQKVLEDDASTEEKEQSIQALLSDPAESRSLPVVSIGAAAIRSLGQMAENAKNGRSSLGIPTGFHDLDTMLAGLHPGNFIIVAARPGVGKTAFALSALLNLARAGYHGLLASLEMKADEISKRGLAMISGVDAQSIRTGALSETEWDDLVDAAEELDKLPLDIVDLPSVNLAKLSGICRRLKRQGKLDVLVVDYLQIMEPSSGKASRQEQIAELSRGLKKLAMALQIPVIALSQLSREVEKRADKRPILADLRESGAIEQDADVVIFIYREENANSSLTVSRAEIIVAKQRSGPTGTVETDFAKPTTHFRDLRSYPAANDPLRHLAA
jgi:replicative DNA helicase